MPDKITYVPGPDGQPRKAEVISFKTDHEEWNSYRLEDGTTIRVKVTAVRIAKLLRADSDDPEYMPTGEPVYNVQHKVEVMADVPEFLYQKSGNS